MDPETSNVARHWAASKGSPGCPHRSTWSRSSSTPSTRAAAGGGAETSVVSSPPRCQLDALFEESDLRSVGATCHRSGLASKAWRIDPEHTGSRASSRRVHRVRAVPRHAHRSSSSRYPGELVHLWRRTRDEPDLVHQPPEQELEVRQTELRIHRLPTWKRGPAMMNAACPARSRACLPAYIAVASVAWGAAGLLGCPAGRDLQAEQSAEVPVSTRLAVTENGCYLTRGHGAREVTRDRREAAGWHTRDFDLGYAAGAGSGFGDYGEGFQNRPSTSMGSTRPTAARKESHRPWSRRSTTSRSSSSTSRST